MFNKNDEAYLLRRIERNEVVLVVGAGFSLMAKNIKNESLPTSGQFSEKLWHFLNYLDQYDQTPLSHLWDLVLNSGIPTDRISGLLNDVFKVKDYHKRYSKITIPFWYKIYTLNVDNLLEKIYDSQSKKIQVLKYPNDENSERDQGLLKTQIVHLNGAIPCKPNEIIFSRSQYAQSTNKMQPLYHEFINDYCTRTTIFIGTQLEEQIFEQYLDRRGMRQPDQNELRPKSFLILPSLSHAKVDLLNLYNIEFVPGTTEDFLSWIETNESNFPDRMETLRISRPNLFSILNNVGNKTTEAINAFGISFKNVNDELIKEKSKNKPSKKFLLGYFPTWEDIVHNMDAQRDIAESIVYDLTVAHKEKVTKLFSLIGSAGSGKSTLIKRVCLELAKQGFPVFFNYSEEIPRPDDLKDALNQLKRRAILFFDNAELMVHKLPHIIELVDQAEIKPIIFISCRTIYLDWLNGDHEAIQKMKKYKLGELSDKEINGIIELLSSQDLLGTLKNKSVGYIFNQFKLRAKSQLLVAMKEATTGKKFDDIIIDEFSKIEPYDARFLAICIAITTEAGFAISKQEFIGFSPTEANTSLTFLETILKDLIFVSGQKKERLVVRHRVIADIILKNTSLDDLKSAYINVLTNLAHEINYREFHSPKFNLYRNVINHKRIYKRFENKIEYAREIYESLKEYFRDDFQFWLQYGSLELEGRGGDIELAENYLNQANGLKSNHPIIRNTLAHFYFKKAQVVDSIADAIECKEQAINLLGKNVLKGDSYEVHTYHILCIGRYYWAKKWSQTQAELVNELSEVKNIAEELSIRNPGNQSLNKLSQFLKGAHLKAGIGLELDSLFDPFLDYFPE